ncbi:hypothetical protein BDN70DRAFT_159673 [Pholiota conissans]|uniref:GDS1 winged helix domain-containing protein n=1 Tax=Pholiota conissans TaxID=109636 RepID=A0A9P5YXY3_9AGAR|nr:hypothetical protein BDN70DRAFT_159673 [Pholiota conissans]
MQSSQRQRPYHTRVRTNDAPATVFPPPGIVLHPDDAASKVFHAVARAFVSVDNRAMTIKDIADRASHHGLVCQNLSAAAQAVTTYLRAHKARCDRQQDQPLLLSHTLSGTPADDDLVPALYSRSGGDSAQPSDGRLTNFRKGTAVWYLSRATGIPCPFTRAGIRLCDYVQHEDDAHERSSRRERREVSCGLKRKRPLRGCVRRDSDEEDDGDEEEEEQRPPKVKLMLRLKPLLPKATPPTVEPQPEGSTSTRPIDVSESDDDDSDESMPVDSSSDDRDESPAAPALNHTKDESWSAPLYPRSSSIPISSHTPSTSEFIPSYPMPTQLQQQQQHISYRSPSVPFATPPPDSDDEADDYHVAMTKNYHDGEDDIDIGWDADLDSEGEEEGETVWESPGPRSPSAPLIHPSEITVKEEPRDVQGMLDAWEDFDTSVAVAEVLSKALETDVTRPQIKLEPLDPWGWDVNHAVEWPSEDPTHIKQEDFGVDSLFSAGPSSSPLTSQLGAFSYSDTQLGSEPDDDIAREYPTVRPRSKTVPATLPFFPTPSSVSPPTPLTSTSSSSSSREPSVPSTALVTLLQSLSVDTGASTVAFTLPPPTPCVSPLQTRCQPTFPLNRPVVVTTCQPCKPAISATQIEGISVYQMILGAFQLLRRIDTDFVNLAPILAIAGAALSANEVPVNAMVVTKGSPEICGTWVPLAAAQAYVQTHLADATGKCAEADRDALRVFLSDTLVELFPPALQEFHRAPPARGLNQFGLHFLSMVQAAKWEAVMDGSNAIHTGSSVASGSVSSAGSTPGSFMTAGSSSPTSTSPPGSLPARPFLLGFGDRHVEKDAPLSATEQQLFHELCVIPDWDRDGEGEDGAMDVDLPTSSSLPENMVALMDLSGALPPAPMSPLSVLSESPLSSPMSSPTITSARLVSAAIVRKRTESTETQKPLRRSKRVADAQLAQPAARGAAAPVRTRGRKVASSRNSLS